VARSLIRPGAYWSDEADDDTSRRQEIEIAYQVCEGVMQGTWAVADHFQHRNWQFIVMRRTGRDGPAPLGLSDREREVVGLALSGHSNKDIAERLQVGEATVATHLRRSLHKLAFESRIELIRLVPRLLVDEALTSHWHGSGLAPGQGRAAGSDAPAAAPRASARRKTYPEAAVSYEQYGATYG
jgi:DNA-binding CsgD family transcriptional regulator